MAAVDLEFSQGDCMGSGMHDYCRALLGVRGIYTSTFCALGREASVQHNDTILSELKKDIGVQYVLCSLILIKLWTAMNERYSI